MLFVTSGEGVITINGVEFPLSDGSLCWLQSYHTYTIEPAFGSTLSFSLCAYDYPLSSYLVTQDADAPGVPGYHAVAARHADAQGEEGDNPAPPQRVRG